MVANKLRALLTHRVKRHDKTVVPIPKAGQALASCTLDHAIKEVAEVRVMEGSIYYTDGTTDSLYYCGWRYPSEIHHTSIPVSERLLEV